MELSALAGNAHVKAVLSQQEGGRGLSHAYILSGPAGSGRHTLARLLCGAMLCAASGGERPCGRCAPCRKVFSGVHPDVAVISGRGKTHHSRPGAGPAFGRLYPSQRGGA